MIRPCDEREFETVRRIINDAAAEHRETISRDYYREPYITREEFDRLIDEATAFYGYVENGQLVGVVGLQHVKEVALIHHLCVAREHRGRGIGRALLDYVQMQTTRPILAAVWASNERMVEFFEKQGFRFLLEAAKRQAGRRYFGMNSYRSQASVLMADDRWFGGSARREMRFVARIIVGVLLILALLILVMLMG